VPAGKWLQTYLGRKTLRKAAANLGKVVDLAAHDFGIAIK
jgi:hypothetical protein